MDTQLPHHVARFKLWNLRQLALFQIRANGLDEVIPRQALDSIQAVSEPELRMLNAHLRKKGEI